MSLSEGDFFRIKTKIISKKVCKYKKCLYLCNVKQEQTLNTTDMKTTNNLQNIEKEIISCIETLKHELAECERILNPAGICIECCPCIIATADGKYTVGVKDNRAEVRIGDLTTVCQFGPETADRIAREFKASNGFGPLIWKVMGRKEFYTIRKANLKKGIEAMEWGLEQYRKNTNK